jgi:sigma-B regulation protein RsbU (phosphoserine phosphatase)
MFAAVDAAPRGYRGGAMSYWIESKPLGEADRSGDFVLCRDIAPHRRAIVVGDIAGHRTAVGDASALCAVVSSLIARGVPLAQVLRAASSVFSQIFTSEATPFASLFLAVADLRERTIDYASAGHEPALLFSGAEAAAHDHLSPTGPLLGVEPRPVFHCRTVPLVRDSLLVVVTDGITEARRDAGDDVVFFGSAGVSGALRDAVRDVRDPARAIYGAAAAYAGGALSDDASVVVSAFPAPRAGRTTSAEAA